MSLNGIPHRQGLQHGKAAARPNCKRWILGLLLCTLTALSCAGALQFDVFIGYDGLVPEACWFPIVCEVKNDGPSFTATVEVKGGYSPDQSLLMPVELPTGTLKRFVIPVFAGGSGYATWDLRLLDERGKMRAEQPGQRPRKLLSQSTPLLGAIPRTPGGTPTIRPIAAQGSGQPAAARLLPSIFPDNPLVLEGLTCLYLNSERAGDLTVNQVEALLGWLNGGGHLIVAVEQPSDITSLPWLKNIFPCKPKDLKIVQRHPELHEWLRSPTWPARSTGLIRPGRAPDNTSQMGVANPFSNLASDLEFEGKEMQVAVGPIQEGRTEVSCGDMPLIVNSQRGRGRVTALLFSPEREPMRSWRELPTFWAKLAEVPGVLYVTKDNPWQTGWSTDGVFGAMIDTRQVHKLPVGWLLLLLLVYLVVIGPFDQFWLKRIGRPMLTWITFPCYVVLFSLVIYFIGYKLRAGESEWNELHVVDILMNGTQAELRGHTYSSVYSPANQRYALASQQKFATLRGEFSAWNASASSEKATIIQTGDGFKADLFVPVWTSQLLVSDWWQASPVPVTASVHSTENGWQINLQNNTAQKLTNVQLALGDLMFNLGAIEAHDSRTQAIGRTEGTSLRAFVLNLGGNFQNAVVSRQHALGSTASGQISDKANSTAAISFISQLAGSDMYQNRFIAPPGLELSSLLEHGEAVLLAWAEGYSPVKPLYQFSPRRSQRDTLWRLALKIE